jgi:hypothetical protein
MVTPAAPLLELPGEPVSSVEAAQHEAALLLNDIRAQFDLDELQMDGTLATLAMQPLSRLQDGSWEPESGEERLRAAGFIGEETAQLVCQASTVARCLTEIMEQPPMRRGVLQPGLGFYGMTAAVDSDGVDIVINLASQ